MVLKLELLEEWPVELKRHEGILVKMGLEPPQHVQLWGISPDEGYNHLASPRLTLEEEGGKLEAWPAIAQR